MSNQHSLIQQKEGVKQNLNWHLKKNVNAKSLFFDLKTINDTANIRFRYTGSQRHTNGKSH